MYCTRFCFARCGLPAGDIFYVMFVRAYALTSFDAFVSRHALVRLTSFVDDDVVNAVGTEEVVVMSLVDAAKDLERVFTEELQVGLAFDTLTTVGSSQHFADAIVQRLGRIGRLCSRSRALLKV